LPSPTSSKSFMAAKYCRFMFIHSDAVDGTLYVSQWMFGYINNL
jgi:hypothetical protein